MRWLVVGSAGMLGQDLVARLHSGRRDGHEVVGVDVAEIDITDPASVASVLPGYDVVVNCAAWTDVDGAEAREPEALRVNADGPRNLARACRATGARLVQISTDYVFAGDARTPYGEDAPLAPASAYGRTKAAGEDAVRAELPEAHLVVRTAWLYGAHGRCFPKVIATAGAAQGALRVVDDQVGQPTWTVDLADLIIRLVEADVPAGTYHGTASGQVSWCGFAREVVAAAGLDPAIVSPVATAEFPRPAPRPAYSVLGHDALHRLGLAPIGDWAERWRVAAPVVLG